MEDIPDLVDYFLGMKDKNISFDKSIYLELKKYPWPGNVRQLQKWVFRICRVFSDRTLSWSDISETLKPNIPSNSDDEFEYPIFPLDYNIYIKRLRELALEKAKGNMSEADRLLKLKEGTTKQWIFQKKRRKQ